MKNAILKVLAGIVAAFLALAVWWGGMAAAAVALGLPPGALPAWSVMGWVGYGIMAISFNAILLELLEKPAGTGEAHKAT